MLLILSQPTEAQQQPQPSTPRLQTPNNNSYLIPKTSTLASATHHLRALRQTPQTAPPSLLNRYCPRHCRPCPMHLQMPNCVQHNCTIEINSFELLHDFSIVQPKLDASPSSAGNFTLCLRALIESLNNLTTQTFFSFSILISCLFILPPRPTP